MDRELPILATVSPAQTCVWMDAGVVAFRLCDRGFACEHCPFDAAMRRDPRQAAPEECEASRGSSAALIFPADRLYTGNHLWVQTIREGLVRAGIDAYAARLLHPVNTVQAVYRPGPLQRGDPWCTVLDDGGEVPFGMPVAGRVSNWNCQLDEHSSILTTEPYGAGWLAEIAVAQSRDLDRLLNAAAARERAVHDARQFRRAVAFHLLSGETGAEPGLDGTFLDRTQRLVGAVPFVALAREFLH